MLRFKAGGQQRKGNFGGLQGEKTRYMAYGQRRILFRSAGGPRVYKTNELHHLELSSPNQLEQKIRVEAEENQNRVSKKARN